MRMARVAPEKMDFLTRPATSLFSQALQEKQVSKKTYFEKSRDPRWQKKRLEVMQDAEFRCKVCYDDSSTLNVHHKEYIKGREPWEYDAKQLTVLCEGCHSAQHETEDLLKVICSYADIDGPKSRRDCALLIAGFIGFPADRLMDMCQANGDSPWVVEAIYMTGEKAYEDVNENIKSRLKFWRGY